MERATKTTFSLFIIESLKLADEKKRRFEGRILRDILHLSGHETDYLYIRTLKELRFALELFRKSRKRYLHISCHGNSETVSLTLDPIPLEDFGKQVRPFLDNRRLFMSACAVVNDKLAKALLHDSACHSLIGPRDDIYFDDAVLMWASFYHLMFRDPGTDAMKGGKIRWALRRTRYAFGVELDYFRPSKTREGYRRVDIDQK